MKRFTVIFFAFILLVSLMAVSAFAASSYESGVVQGEKVVVDGSIPAGRYTLRVVGKYNGYNYDFTSDPFDFDGKTANVKHSGRLVYRLAAEYDATANKTFYALLDAKNHDKSGISDSMSGVVVFHLNPLTSGSDFFLGNIVSVLVTVISWTGMVLNSIVDPGGALNSLLPIIGVCVAVPALFLGIKAVRKFIWGA